MSLLGVDVSVGWGWPSANALLVAQWTPAGDSHVVVVVCQVLDMVAVPVAVGVSGACVTCLFTAETVIVVAQSV